MATSTIDFSHAGTRECDPGLGSFARFNRDWALLEDDVPACRQVAEWAQRFAELAGVRTPQDIVDRLDALRRASDWPAYDGVFRVLLGLTRLDGAEGQLAWLIGVRIMLPKAVLITSGLIRVGFDWEDTSSLVLSALFEIVRTYPLEDRPARIFINIALDTRKLAERLIGVSSVEERERECMTEALSIRPADPEADQPETVALLADLLARASHLQLLAEEDHGLVDAGLDPRTELIDLLVWAVEARALSEVEARRIAGYYRPTDDRSARTTRAMGSEGARIRQSASRAVRTLRGADLNSYFDIAA
ncbi:hypothetical protein ACFRMQ_14535 [Kitasatospora sp. NPDC056783]|uniref:hypothetical protein n=1 Tax=Kitasatospora sp. NPDC056783 TaxID=3345943 RepID=UPI0036804E28